MPEQDQEKQLDGTTIETSSSDSAIAVTVARLRSEIEGTVGVVDSLTEVLGPKIISGGGAFVDSDLPEATDPSFELSRTDPFDPLKSRAGVQIHFERQKKIGQRKAA